MGKEEQNKQDSNSRMIAADNCGLEENGRQTQREMLTECGKGEEAAENGGLQESGQQEQREILTESGKDEKAAENGGLQESGQKEQRKMLTEGRKGEEAAENCSLQESGRQTQREMRTDFSPPMATRCHPFPSDIPPSTKSESSWVNLTVCGLRLYIHNGVPAASGSDAWTYDLVRRSSLKGFSSANNASLPSSCGQSPCDATRFQPG